MSERIVMTGFGCLTAAGATADATWAAIKSGRSGIAPATTWAETDWKFGLAAEIKDYNPRKMVSDRKLLKAIERQDVLGLNAVDQALEHSGLVTYRDSLEDPERVNDRIGVFVGSPGNKYQQRYDYLETLADSDGNIARFGAETMERVHPMWLLRSLPNNVLAYVGIQRGFKGVNHNFTNHGVSGTQAIAEACNYMREGEIDRAVVAGYDYALDPETMLYYATLGVLSTHGVRSFDANRDGTVLAEGAGALVLETLTAARERGATIWGEVLGASIVSEGQGILAVRPDGDGVSRAIGKALDAAGRRPADIGMITAHGNGTQNSDASEATAIVSQFGAATVPVTGFKWGLGHTLAASGVIEAILTLYCLREGEVPGIPTLERRSYECEGLAVSQASAAPRGRLALMVTRAFAGLNSCLVLSGEPGE